jgi:hypothetical protein
MVGKRKLCYRLSVVMLFIFFQFAWNAFSEQNALQGQPAKVNLSHSYSASSRRRYKLIVSADAVMVLGIQRTVLQFSANVDIETALKGKTRGGEMIVEFRVVGGVMRLFGAGWRQTERVPAQTATITMTPKGQILSISGLTDSDVFETAAGLDIVSLAVGTICVGLPNEPVGVGDAWHVEHRVSDRRPIVAHTKLVKISSPLPQQLVAHMETRYDIPIDWFLPNELKLLYNVRAHHKGVTTVEFDCNEGCVESGEGNVEIEVQMSIPVAELPPEVVASAVKPQSTSKPNQQAERGEANTEETTNKLNEDATEPTEENAGEGKEVAEEQKEHEEQALPNEVPFNMTIRAQFQLIRQW